MKRCDIYVLLSWLVLFLAGGCSRFAEEEAALEEPVRVRLDIGVFLTDESSPETRASRSYETAVTDDEKMRKLRIVIVRPDGTVEHNRLLNLTAVEAYDDEKFMVAANETKRIYLFVNEGLTTIENKVSEDAALKNLDTYDFDAIKPGDFFPSKEVTSFTFGLGGSTEELAGPLPMSECHRVWVPKEGGSCRLFVTRAAVKFSFRIKNESGRSLTLTELAIDKMLRKEYCLPMNTVYGVPNADGGREIISFDVPAVGNNDYYTFRKTFGDAGISLTAGGETALDAIYLMESKYSDPATVVAGDDLPLNYSMSMSFKELGGERLQSKYFPNLPQLPRNTHVAVTIVIGQGEITWTVDVVPYGEIILDPVFGLDEDSANDGDKNKEGSTDENAI